MPEAACVEREGPASPCSYLPSEAGIQGYGCAGLPGSHPSGFKCGEDTDSQAGVLGGVGNVEGGGRGNGVEVPRPLHLQPGEQLQAEVQLLCEGDGRHYRGTEGISSVLCFQLGEADKAAASGDEGLWGEVAAAVNAEEYR